MRFFLPLLTCPCAVRSIKTIITYRADSWYPYCARLWIINSAAGSRHKGDSMVKDIVYLDDKLEDELLGPFTFAKQQM